MKLSVVMPYYENQRTLAACLTSLDRQSVAPDEIIVVDDGSPVAAAAPAGMRVPVQILRARHGGQSAATNAGIRAARGEVVLLTCADVVADSRLVEEHLSAHAQARHERVGVGGSIPYASWLPRTPFMRYLAKDGVQFAFGQITDPEHMPPMMCYAPNFSARRADLHALGGFDERFDYGYQDTDLGLRLAYLRQVRLLYRPQAIALHDHPNSLRRFVARNRRVGHATLCLWEKYPRYAERVRAVVRRQARHVLPMVPDFPALLAEAEALEARLGVAANIPPEPAKRLEKLFELICMLALYDGMMQHRDRMLALKMVPPLPPRRAKAAAAAPLAGAAAAALSAGPAPTSAAAAAAATHGRAAASPVPPMAAAPAASAPAP